MLSLHSDKLASEIKDWKLLDFVHYTATLWTRRWNRYAANVGASVGNAKEMNAKAKTRQEQLKEDIKCHPEAFLEGFRSCGKRATACQIPSVVCPE
jgi:hypothetical protein